MERVKAADNIADLTDEELLLELQIKKLELEALRRGLIKKESTPVYQKAKVVEPQKLYTSITNTISNSKSIEKFKLEKAEKFQNASLKLYFQPQLEYDEYSGGYEKFFKDFKMLNKSVIRSILKHFPTFKINYCFH